VNRFAMRSVIRAGARRFAEDYNKKVTAQRNFPRMHTQ
jgi:hypothetical protein